MADSTLPNLPSASALSAGDYFYVTQSGSPVKATVAQLNTYVDNNIPVASTTDVLTGTSTSSYVTPDALAALWEQGSNVASASTIPLGEGGYFNITGTTTITDIDFATDKAGRIAWVKFAGALTLTHNASTLILPGGANITTAAGDTACFVSEGSDVVRCVAYQQAIGGGLGIGPAPTDSLFSITVNSPTITNLIRSYKISKAPTVSAICARMRTLPGTDFTLTVHVCSSTLGGAYNGFGIVLRDNSGTPKFSTCHINQDVGTWNFTSENWSSSTAYASFNSGGLAGGSADSPPSWLRVAFTHATNDFICYCSWDGVDWVTGPTSTYLGTADAVGLMVLASNGTYSPSVWFDYYSFV